jgi:D-arabinose 5-phosphate isomerase GutQ
MAVSTDRPQLRGRHPTVVARSACQAQRAATGPRRDQTGTLQAMATSPGEEPSAFSHEAVRLMVESHSTLLGSIHVANISPMDSVSYSILDAIELRMKATYDLLLATASGSAAAIDAAILQFARWMDERAIVRILGAGRARLAAAIPANRMAHGGAHIYMQDESVPMPHSIHGGGVIAASASGHTPSVLSALAQARQKNKDITVVGIASVHARPFADACDIFIGIPDESEDTVNPLRALADTEEFVISQLLDSLVVAAGQHLGYTDATWRLGHEDLGPATGFYDFLPGR